jgi:hypothetical protein
MYYFIYPEEKHIYIRTDAAWPSPNIYVTLEYTKTTDAENSGVNLMPYSFVQNASNNYSTEEQIVGRWIDGKPLYQKTIIGNFESSDKITEIQVDDLNIDIIVNITGITNDFSGTTKYQRLIPMVFGGVNSASITERLSIYYRNNADGKSILLNYGGVAVNEYIITIQYTKTTD